VSTIVIVGPGRAGRALHARLVARGADATLTRDPAAAAGAETVLIAVPDDAIAAVAARVPPGAWVGMLSGATPLATLGAGPRRFVLHPLQTLTADGGAAQLDGVAACVTGATPAALAHATALATRLGLRAVALPESARPLPHIAAVLASNYVVSLLAAATDLLVAAGVPAGDAPALLAPLVRRTVANALADGASMQPTGPVARGDAGTVERHLDVLAERLPTLVELYGALGRATLPLVPASAAARVAPLLARDRLEASTR
jgi:predicted short-subunit dehydrogenase-like oxidoreductase (DUF2520 family)